jgi:hypothetical protein
MVPFYLRRVMMHEYFSSFSILSICDGLDGNTLEKCDNIIGRL